MKYGVSLKFNIKAVVLVLVCGASIHFSCKTSDLIPDDDNYFIFGVGYCECSGHCATVYKIASDSLYSGMGSSCVESYYIYPGPALSQDKYDIAIQLVNSFPKELIENTEDRYGCPDCADQGGYYLERKSSGNLRTWMIDTNENALPGFLREYQAMLRQVMLDLQ